MNYYPIFLLCSFLIIGLGLGKELKATINVKHCTSTDPQSEQFTKNQVDVICTGPWSLNFRGDYNCKFQLYDGEIVNWYRKENLSYGRYKKIMIPENSNSPLQCGITVDLPKNDTSNGTGLWKCWIMYTNSEQKEKTIGAMVNILDPKSKNLTLGSIEKDVYVARGDDFMIECQGPNEIDLCFMKSPGGTLFAVTKNITSKKSNSLFRYQIDSCNIDSEQVNYNYKKILENEIACAEALKRRNELKSVGRPINRLELTGEGFHMGVCAAVVGYAGDTHNGIWTCYLDLVNGVEFKKQVPVHVTESYLICSVEKNGTITTIGCNKFPDFSSDITNCRWILPNNTGIYKEKSNEFKVMQDKNSCTLQLNEWKEEYAGEWQCYAQFKFPSQPNNYDSADVVTEIFDAIEIISVK